MNTETKQELRAKIKNERRSMPKKDKEASDKAIADNLIKSGLLNKSELVLIYLSTEIEVDTKKILEYCMENKINIAVPRCVGKRKMNFYFYNNSTKFEKSNFGIYEPVADDSNMVRNFKNSLCIVPGLSFDKNGYRLGYGGGFYDTFLAENSDMKTVGICYSRHITAKLPVDKFDKHVDFVITENNMEVCNG